MNYPSAKPDIAEALCATVRRLGERGWCRATSGNFSARLDDNRCLITRSGRHKARLSADDLMVCDFEGTAMEPGCTPSAETPLHTSLYALDDGIGAVLHTHSVMATVLSRRFPDALAFSGFEMQKAFAGVASHEGRLAVRVFANDQDMVALSGRVRASHPTLEVPGFLIAGHGLYAWGRDIAEAERHVEGFEFLFDCLWQEQLAGGG